MMSRKNKKPIEFTLSNEKYILKYVDVFNKEECISEEKFSWGHFNSLDKSITVSTEDLEGNPLQDSTIEISKLHEIIHAIFEAGQYNACSEDEPLVEWTARCLYELIKQKVL